MCINLKILCRTNRVILRNFSSKKSTFYVTTPIYYVNAAPHIGHLYSSVISDAIQRYQRLIKPQQLVRFVTGTDEHGQKIQKSAKANNVPIQTYCTNISNQYKLLADKFSVNYTDFIRTTEDHHIKTVQEFWKTIYNNGYIYSSEYVGWYCVSDETFLSETQVKDIESPKGDKIKISLESGNVVEWADEKNYMFRLSSLQDDLIYWLTRNENVVKPKVFYKILLEAISNDKLPDWSISRPSSRIYWGIKVPGDDTQTIHVWLDALVNYLTVAGYKSLENFNEVWPPDIQVVGKDILKFHGIYWPAFLLAANLEPPKCLLCHSHWTVDNQKMSKSKNNVICPINFSEKYTTEGLRYFLLREGVAHSDGNFSEEKVIRILDSELANTIGNLLNRCCSIALNPNQEFPQLDLEAFQEIASIDVTKKLIELVVALPDTCQLYYTDLNFHEVIRSVISTLHSANLFFETLKPWELKTKEKHLNSVLHITMETLRICSIILIPVIPNISQQILNKLKVDVRERVWSYLKVRSWETDTFTKRNLDEDKSVVFERIRLKEGKKNKLHN